MTLVSGQALWTARVTSIPFILAERVSGNHRGKLGVREQSNPLSRFKYPINIIPKP